MNSFRNVERAIEYEIERQTEVLDDGEPGGAGDAPVGSRPRGDALDALQGAAHDYRYFPEPDLLPLVVTDEWVEDVRARAARAARRAPRSASPREYGLPPYDAEVLTARKDVADYFETAVRAHANAKAISNWVMGDVLRIVRERKLDDGAGDPRLAGVARAPRRRWCELIDDGDISGKIAKTVFEEMVATGKAPAAIVAEQGLSRSPTRRHRRPPSTPCWRPTPTRWPSTAAARTSSSASSSAR